MPTTQSPRSRLRVLVVDDDELVRRSLERALRGRAEVFSAADPVMAREVLRARAVDVIVSDHSMHGETGLSLLVAVSQLRPDAVRVLFSAQPPLEAYDALDDGLIDALFHKPTEGHKLVDFVLHGSLKPAVAAG
jgi:DNA-binding NtrC family response regulator